MNSNAISPSFEQWRTLVENLQLAASCRSATFQQALKLCIEQRFMIAQMALVQPTSQLSSIRQPDLAKQVCECLTPLLQGTGSRLQATPFGNESHLRLTVHQTEFLWCLALETVVLVSPGSLVENSLGSNGQSIEIEIGSDCQMLEQISLSQLDTMRWARIWLPELETNDHRCPLGGGAVQIRFPVHAQSRNRTRVA